MLTTEELMHLNCAGEDSWQSFGTAWRSNQSILKEINPEYSLEGLMLKLKLQYFGHLMRRGDSLEKTLMLGKIEDRRRRGQHRMRWLHGYEFQQTPWNGKGQGSLACCSPWGCKELDMTEQCQTLFFGAPKSLQMVIAAMKLKDAYSLEGKLWPT